MNKLLSRTFLIVLLVSLFRDSLGWCQRYIIQEEGAVQCVDYSRDGKYMVTTTSTHATVWYTSTKSIYHRFTITSCHCAKFSDNSPTTRLAITASQRVYVYNLADFSEVRTNWNPNIGNNFIYVDYRSSDKVLTCNRKSGSNHMIVWDLGSTPPSNSVDIDENNGIVCKFADNGQIGTTSTADKIRYYPSNGGTKDWEVTNKIECIQLAFSSGSDRLIAACDDNGQYGVLIDSFGGGSRNVLALLTTGGRVNTVDYARNGGHYVFGGTQKIVHIFNSSSDKVIQKFITDSEIKDSDFNQLGDFLAIGTTNGKIYIYARYCIGCDPGYYYDSTNKICMDCWTAIHGCGSCTSSGVCVQCVEGFIMNAGACDNCKLNLVGCGSCIDANNCSFCLPGFYLNTTSANFVCERCENILRGCYVCENESVCLQCQSDFYLDTTLNQCVDCTNVNAHCIKCHSQTNCSECQLGFYENAGGCSECSTNCYACQSLNNCTDCFQGYYPNNVGGNIICQQCSYGCLACNATGYCTDCFDQRFVSGTGTCDMCNYPCSTCNTSATTCLSCISGYYKVGTTCTKCPYPCLTCNDSSTCLACPPTYFLNGNDCDLCIETYGNCSVCDNTQCFNCDMGYFLDTAVTPKVCESCPTKMHACVSCNTSTNCLICGAGYYHKGIANNGNNSCEICPFSCSACYSSSNCTSCHNGFYLDTGTDTCKVCTNKCVRCTSNTNCLQCKLGYYLSGTSCLACSGIDTHCVACAYDIVSTSTICTSCEIGMFYDSVNDLCDYCKANCTACVDATNCTACELGKYLDTVLDDCLDCHQNCSECSSLTNCMSCNAGFYLTVNNTCQSCSAFGCATCNSTNFNCLSCNLGYFLDTTTNPDSCKSCLKSITYCSVCTSSTNCQLCAYGFALATNHSTCLPCSNIEGCKHCLKITSCSNCDIGYYLVPNGSGNNICTQCGLGCQDCDDLGVCKECIIQYTLVLPASTCSLCSSFMDGCLQCSTSLICDTCKIGFYLNQTTDKCFLCSNSIFGCLYCDNNMTCTHCFDGYYLNTTDNTCKPCDDNLYGCQLCNSSTICLSCQFGLYLNNSQCYLCEANIANCQYCEDQNTCKFCKSGSFLVSNSCAICQAHIPGCILCNSGSECLQCQGGYYLDSVSDLCQPCNNQGCQICKETDPNKCISCNSKFYLNLTQQTCELCRGTISGCMQCINSTKCSACDPGFFINSTFDCQLCSIPLTGCGRCESDLVCLECKASFYLLPNNTCYQCKLVMPGCMYCINESQCQSCWHGYYLSNTDKQCYSCNTIEGCVSCVNQNRCLYCQPDYFLQKSDNLCYACSALVGCYACVSNQTCSICSGGYIINNNQLCSKMRVQAYAQVEQMKLITLYVNETALKHQLYAKGMTYNRQVNLSAIDWSNTTKLVLQDQTYQQIDLVIKGVNWGQTTNVLEFITNNPMNLQKKNYNMVKDETVKRLLLEGSIPDQFKIHLKMDQKLVNKLLPDFFHNQDLVMDYDVDSPEFVQSYVEYSSTVIDIMYSAFGIIVTVILLVMYIVKAVHTAPNSYQMGSIMPHFFATKVPALILYPTFVQFISYCYGFMTADLPWANKELGLIYGDKTDVTPTSYKFLYINLNIGSTYFIAMITIIVLGIILYIYYRTKEDEFPDRYPIGEVFMNFFVFGAAFAGCICIIGALDNKIQEVDTNTIFYMLGIAFDSFVLGFITFRLYKSRHNFCLLRAFIKASLLGLSTFSPIYIFFAAIAVDLICMVVQFCIVHRIQNNYPKLWIMKNLALNLSLCLLVLNPEIKLTIIIASILIGIALILDIYTHIQQYRNKKHISLRSIEISQKNSTTQQINIWDINFEKDSKHHSRKQNEETEMANTKTTFINTRNSSFGADFIARRNKFKRSKNQPKPDVLQVVQPQKQDNEQIEEISINTLRKR